MDREGIQLDDFKSAVWQRFERTVLQMRAQLRKQNDNPSLPLEEIRVNQGRIQQLNKILALPRTMQNQGSDRQDADLSE